MSCGETLQWACSPFATVDDFFGCPTCECSADADDQDHVALIERAIDAASDRLCILSAHSLRGNCTETVTFCRDYSCSCGGACGCGFDIVQLGSPITRLLNVAFDGYAFDIDDFRFIDDGGIAWAPAAARTWPEGVEVEIEYAYGRDVDEFVKGCALDLACATVRRCLSGDQPLGKNLGSVQRQGLQVQRRQVSFFADLTQMAATDRPWMAEFLAIYNPDRARTEPFLWSPDLDDVRVVRAAI